MYISCTHRFILFTQISLPTDDTKGRASIARPFTSEDNSKARQLWTPAIESCDVAIEINLAPSTSKEDLKLSLSSVNVGYKGFRIRPENEHGQPRRKLSGSCNIDVVCPEGNGWEAEISSVAVYSTGGGTFCTGAMINNANEDGTPFFLTAAHCGITSSNAPSLVTYWNFQSSQCIDGQIDQSILLVQVVFISMKISQGILYAHLFTLRPTPPTHKVVEKSHIWVSFSPSVILKSENCLCSPPLLSPP